MGKQRIARKSTKKPQKIPRPPPSISVSSSSSCSSSSSNSVTSPLSIVSTDNSVDCKSLVKSNIQPVTDRRKRLAANARERKRMHLLNEAYNMLRLRLKDAQNTSKYDILVQAKEYIQALTLKCQQTANARIVREIDLRRF